MATGRGTALLSNTVSPLGEPPKSRAAGEVPPPPGTWPLKRRGVLAVLLAVTAVGAVLRFLMAGWYLHLNQDATYLFLPCARQLADGNWQAGLDHSVPTGFLVLHGVWLALFGGEPEFCARLLTVTIGTLCVPMVYLLARAFLTNGPALFAAALMAVNPKSVELSGRVSSEVPYAFFLALSLWLGILAIRRRGPLLPALAGLGTGLSYLVRPEGMVVLPIIAAGFLSLPRHKVMGRLTATVLPMTAFFLAFALGATPMIWVNYQATGRVSLSNKGGISLERRERGAELALVDPDHTITELRHSLSREGYRPFHLLDHVASDPIGFADRWFRRLGGFLSRYLPRVSLISILVGVVLCLGFLRRSRPRPWHGRLFLYLGGTIAVYLAALAFFFESDRFVLPMVPVLAVLAAPGLLATASWLDSRRHYLGVLLLVLAMGGDLINCSRKLNKYDGFTLGWRANPYAAIGAKLRKLYPAGKILSPAGVIAYYAGAEAVIFPKDEYSALIDYARHHQVELIAYRESGWPDESDELHEVISEWPAHPAELQDLGVIAHPTPKGVVVVRVWRVR